MTAENRAARYAADPFNGGIPGMGKGVPAPAAVKVRLSGDTPWITDALRLLHAAAETAGFAVTSQSRPRPNRDEPGYRVYLTLRFPEEDTESRRAAHRRQAIRRPAAPPRRHLP
jgi:hypothetical protein